MATTADRIGSWVGANAGRLGLRAVGTARVSLIGTGESYAAWRVRVPGAESLVIRIARRAAGGMARPMADEFAAMGLVPPGLGPRPVLLEESSGPFGAPFMVTGYVPGRTVGPAGWTDELLTAHARQMAVLHAEPHPIGNPPPSLTAKLAESLETWRRFHPRVFDDPEVTRLTGLVERHAAAAGPVFARLDRLALVHGDLAVPNIVVDRGTPRYVDWEWGRIGDPARDLAHLGGSIAAAPWHLDLPAERIELLLRAYVAAAGEAAGSLEDLRVRRDAFEVYQRFISCLYFRTRLGDAENRRSGRYTGTVRQLTDGLHRRLRDR